MNEIGCNCVVSRQISTTITITPAKNCQLGLNYDYLEMCN